MSGDEQIPETIMRFMEARKNFHTDESTEKALRYKPGATDVVISTAVKSGTTLTQQVEIT